MLKCLTRIINYAGGRVLSTLLNPLELYYDSVGTVVMVVDWPFSVLYLNLKVLFLKGGGGVIQYY